MKKFVGFFVSLLVLGLLFQSACGQVVFKAQYPDGPAGNAVAYMTLDRQEDTQSKVATPFTWKCENATSSFDVWIEVSKVSKSQMWVNSFTIIAQKGTVGLITADLLPSKQGNAFHVDLWGDPLFEGQSRKVTVNKWMQAMPTTLEIHTGYWLNSGICGQIAQIRMDS